jgi:hypothetical protein
MYKFGTEFSLSWVRSLGYEKLPDDIELKLGKLSDEMRAVVEEFTNRKK